jgi:hypothetical protein
MVRSHGAGIAVTAQSYAGMGEDADRILGAAAGLIVHQCADPERLLTRAGQDLAFSRRISFSERGMGQAVKEYALGEGMLAATEELKVSPDRVKQLAPGECFVIVGGCAQEVRVSQITLVKQRDGTTASQDALARQAIEGIDGERRRSYRQAVEGADQLGTTGAHARPPALETDILTLGTAPALEGALPPLPADLLAEPPTSIAAEQHEACSPASEQIEPDEPDEADDMVHSGDRA